MEQIRIGRGKYFGKVTLVVGKSAPCFWRCYGKETASSLKKIETRPQSLPKKILLAIYSEGSAMHRIYLTQQVFSCVNPASIPVSSAQLTPIKP